MINKISVIGLGYVGLPLAISAGKSNFQVNCIDIDLPKINSLKSGETNIEGVDGSELKDLIKSKHLTFTDNFMGIVESQIIVICVPTPLTSTHEPDLSYLLDAIKMISTYLSAGTLVIFESTVGPGTTRDILVPSIQLHSKLAEDQLLVAFSPERVDPANNIWNIKNTPKLVAGLNEISAKTASDFYSRFIDDIVICKSFEIAEISKLLENSFRLLNIAFVNELSYFCQKYEVDVHEVIRSAATKPYGFMPFYPSLGAGGHCIPVDPVYLFDKAASIGTPLKLLELAFRLNIDTPLQFIQRVERTFGNLKNQKILVLGIAYKPDVRDIRESPVISMIRILREKNAIVSWHDELVKEWNDEKSVDLKPGFDLAIIATAHTYMDLTKLGDTPILDTRGSI